jgi:penicillin-binding protein 1A
MALPIWGIFMKKVLADGKLGVTINDKFAVPQDFDVDMNCPNPVADTGTGEGETGEGETEAQDEFIQEN